MISQITNFFRFVCQNTPRVRSGFILILALCVGCSSQSQPKIISAKYAESVKVSTNSPNEAIILVTYDERSHQTIFGVGSAELAINKLGQVWDTVSGGLATNLHIPNSTEFMVREDGTVFHRFSPTGPAMSVGRILVMSNKNLRLAQESNEFKEYTRDLQPLGERRDKLILLQK